MTGHDEVERLVAVITTDCYNLAEQVTACYEAFAEEVPLPTAATVIGTTVEVVGICEWQIAHPGRRGRVLSPPVPLNRSG